MLRPGQGVSQHGGHGTTPTATVQPTLLSAGASVKPVVGTVSPVRPGVGQYQYPGHTGHMYTAPGQYGSAGNYQGQYLPYPTLPYQTGQYPQQKCNVGTDQHTPAGASPSYQGAPPGFFIAGGSGPSYPGTSGNNVNTAGNVPQGFICGPYNYPYGQSRVIGPIIAIGNKDNLIILSGYINLMCFQLLVLVPAQCLVALLF